MDEASKLLVKLTILQQQLPIGYRKISPNLPSVDEVNDLIPSTVNLNFPLESETHITQVDEPLVDQVVDLIISSFDPIFPLESELNTT